MFFAFQPEQRPARRPHAPDKHPHVVRDYLQKDISLGLQYINWAAETLLVSNVARSQKELHTPVLTHAPTKQNHKLLQSLFH